MSTFNYHENENWNPKKPNRFVIETEWDTNFWSLLPQINWNRHFCEIELRWLCAGIMFRDNEKFYYKSTRYVGRLKSDVPKEKERKWTYWTQWMP